MANELVISATNDKLTEMDWAKNIEICELVTHDHSQAKDVVKAIKKCLGSKHSNTQLLTVMLLEMLINNIGEHIHKQVIDMGILPELVKIVKKKLNLSLGEKIFLLLDAAQTSVGGSSGGFPQYYSAYGELVNAGVQFPQSSDTARPHSTSENKNNSANKQSEAPPFERKGPQTHPQNVSGSSLLQKAGTALEVLRDVLNAVDTQHSQGAKDEFTLDLVEQCSFHKQQVMHLAITSRDDKAGEEEEAEQLLRRIRKGKARLLPEDKDGQRDWQLRSKGHSIPGEMPHSPITRPLNLERPKHEPIQPPTMEPMQAAAQPPTMELKQEAIIGKPVVALPPPPARRVERDRFFQEKEADSSALNGHMSSLSVHSRNASTS